MPEQHIVGDKLQVWIRVLYRRCPSINAGDAVEVQGNRKSHNCRRTNRLRIIHDNFAHAFRVKLKELWVKKHLKCMFQLKRSLQILFWVGWSVAANSIPEEYTCHGMLNRATKIVWEQHQGELMSETRYWEAWEHPPVLKQCLSKSRHTVIQGIRLTRPKLLRGFNKIHNAYFIIHGDSRH